jgi:polyphosphate kinase 2
MKDGPKKRKKMKRKLYEQELERLQVELCLLQRWIREKGLRIIVVFEGRDAAGKGGVIKRITERVSSRVFRVVALPAPNDRERSQLYIQRYMQHFPAAGEVVLFDRSWYNRAGVEPVMGFCTDEEYERFMQVIPTMEREIVSSGLKIIKYFFDVSQQEQERRFKRRRDQPLRQWKLSPMDLESYRRWWDYTKAYDAMFRRTDTDHAPWYVVKADDKRRARLNCISHLLSLIPYKALPFDRPDLPKREPRGTDVPEKPAYRNIVPERF